MNIKLIIIILLINFSSQLAAEDSRIRVDLPEPAREHMLSNMRDHLMALESITRKLSSHQYDAAAELAETRLGMSSLKSHGAAHLSTMLPEPMAAIGTRMHKSASRFALAAADAELDGGLNRAFSALSDVMQECVACHSGYRVH